jgi:hypothetical protein
VNLGRILIALMVLMPMAATPQIAVCKDLYIAPPDNAQMSAIFHAPDQWAQSRRYVTGIIRSDHSLEQVDEAELRYWFQQLRVWNMKLELEAGAIKPWSAKGDETYRREVPHWQRAERLGGVLASIAMDGPLAVTLNHFHLDMNYSIDETAKFIALVRKNYPNVKIGDIEPYPGLALPVHQAWLDALQAKLSDIGVAGLDFYRLDVNWVNFAVQGMGNWQQVKDIEQICHVRKIPFSLIYWASDFSVQEKLGRPIDSIWDESTMSEGRAFAAVGGQPDQYVLESWLGIPKIALPETNSVTFMGSVLDFSRQYVK